MGKTHSKAAALSRGAILWQHWPDNGADWFSGVKPLWAKVGSRFESVRLVDSRGFYAYGFSIVIFGEKGKHGR